MEPSDNGVITGSFRDPSGFVFRENGKVYRQINKSYSENYEQLMQSGLYKNLADAGLLIPHEEAPVHSSEPGGAYKTIRPEAIPFISYPYEWCFGQLKDAALLILEIEKKAIELGMSLKDASVYNVQFLRSKPVLIDTLSFEKYRQGEPWIAYKQFCQHFLAPLALASFKDARLTQLLRIYIDGIPLDLANSLLPFRSRLNPYLFLHVHLHAKCQEHFENKPVSKKNIDRTAFLAIIDSLRSVVSGLKWRPRKTAWSGYYMDTNYSADSFMRKKNIVSGFLNKVNSETVWDLGSNTGVFSRIAADKGMDVVSFDADHSCVEKNYAECIEKKRTNVLPILLDLTNPSPAIGWDNRERLSLSERGPADTALALALIHHLAIANNLPMDKIAEFFSKICRRLIIEFVPKTDSQVKRLLISREDIFSCYSQESFEKEFSEFFDICSAEHIDGTDRKLYYMIRKK